MPLRGTAFLAIWHDIEPAGEREYNAWHTREHMPERVGIAGFEAGRRFVDWGRDRHRYFTLYETETIHVLGSAAYRARLDTPSAWTRRVQPTFLNFVRAACTTMASEGRGTGGALATLRIDVGASPGQLVRGGDGLVETALALHGVTGIHVGVAEPALTRTPTAESALRAHSSDAVFCAAVLVEGIGRREVSEALPAVERALAPLVEDAPVVSAVYDLAYSLTAEEL
jgi:hypothetical protein